MYDDDQIQPEVPLADEDLDDITGGSFVNSVLPQGSAQLPIG